MSSVMLLKFLLAVLVILRVATFQADQDLIYRFSDQGSLPICPLVIPSPNPSFALQPLPISPEFLIGNYTYTIPEVMGFRFNQDTKLCASGVRCTELSVQYSPDRPGRPLRSTFNITFTYGGGRQRIIQVDFGFRGIYVVGTNRLLRRQANEVATLDGFIVVYGEVPQPLVICDSSGNFSDQFSLSIANDDIPCAESTLNSGAGRPTRVNIVVEDGAMMGEHVLYVAGKNNCRSSLLSEEFTVSLEPAMPTTSENMGSTTVTDGTGGDSDSTDAIIGGVVGAAVVICVIAAALLGVWCTFCRNKAPHMQQNGRGHGVEDALNFIPDSPELSGEDVDKTHPNPIVNGHIPQEGQVRWIVSVAPKSKDYEVLEDGLADYHHLERKTLHKGNTNLIRSTLSKKECIMYILQDDNSEITDSVDRHPPAAHLDSMIEIATLNSDKKCRDNVFVVRFKAEKQCHIEQSHYHLLLRTEDPTSEGFNSSICAHSIYCDVMRIRGEMVSIDPNRQLVAIGQQLHSLQQKVDKSFESQGQQMQKGFESQGQQMQKGFESQGQQMQKGFESQGQQMQKGFESQGQQMQEGFEQIKGDLIAVEETVEKLADDFADKDMQVQHPHPDQ